MSALIRLDAQGRASIEGEAGALRQDATPRIVGGGRGDARIATYVKKPAPAGAGARDWREDGLIPLADWLAGDRAAPPVLLPPDDPFALADHVGALDLIGVAFPKFNDGRGMSHAVLLRKRLGYRGQLRAVGDVAHDQLFYMARCGFDAFALRADQDPHAAVKAFADFGEVYQDAADRFTPIFRRRAEAVREAQAWLAARTQS